MSGENLKYRHLLSPYRIGNVVFKNRMIATSSTPFLNQGPGNCPDEAIIQHFINKAKSGAGIVVFGDVFAPGRPPRPMDNCDPEHIMNTRRTNPNEFNPDHGWFVNSGRPYIFDILNGACQNVLSNMVEAMHMYGAKVIMKMRVESPHGFDVSPDNAPDRTEVGSGGAMVRGKVLSEEQLLAVVEEYGFQAQLAKEIGFDGVYVHMAYGGPLTARLLSPLTNRRHDQFGIDSFENRTRFTIMALDKIKEKCGNDFITYAIISGEEPEGGYSVQDMVEFARLFEGHLDMLHLKGKRNDLSHPTGFTMERYPFLEYARAVKEAVPGLAVVANGGFNDLDDSEEVIASGKADFVGTARAWICNEDYGELAYEGRNEDVVPCLRCNKCHISSYYRPWTSVCAVNPMWGMEHREKDLLKAPKRLKKVAVIGGGPAGMEAALTAARLGHSVVLFEKEAELGGLLRRYSGISFKWPYKEYLDFMVKKTGESGIDVRLDTMATPGILESEGCDAVIAAVGSRLDVPDIRGLSEAFDNLASGSKGSDKVKIIGVTDVFGREKELTGDVVIIGGGQAGVECGMHLAELGSKVTVLERFSKLAKDAAPLQFYSMFEEAWESIENFTGIVNSEVTAIDEADGGRLQVTYIDADGTEQSITAGSIVLACGMKPDTDGALSFASLGKQMILVGDCNFVGNIQTAVRSGFGAVYTI